MKNGTKKLQWAMVQILYLFIYCQLAVLLKDLWQLRVDSQSIRLQ